MKLHPDWRKILRHAWSIQLDILNIVVTAALSVVPILTGTTLVAPLTLAFISAGLTVVSMGLRLLKQEKVSGNEPPP